MINHISILVGWLSVNRFFLVNREILLIVRLRVGIMINLVNLFVDRSLLLYDCLLIDGTLLPVERTSIDKTVR